ncbi:sugar ABC transporter ATP-binding protein [Agathobaculum sp. NTUH-O15-33]|uniref:sugar ABC transporter ATP-binding protein n=1 Tax=Agathobaculum sp. NTUH-O15-33 TaxID=3079302 RepID=UPI002958C798|nr:sugar ABC transporter ATP-binding protein [Agathobaculum sp. NTUH-O15-33]WNX85970.1 sugar ABC transporter ATP-binding protein [Agathobaculum sp. NTUH-O15-33]
MSNQQPYVLEMRNIVKIFPGVRALDGVNLKVRAGKVHVICGENGAGKSTLMKVINGSHDADEGEMFFEGKPVGKHTIQDTMKMGIAMIYQELNPVLEMTIAENVFLGREPKSGPFVDFAKMIKDTQALLDRLQIPYDAHQKMRELSIAGHQLIEIAKAISMNAKVIIMDEPSSAIADAEIEVLFGQIFSLKEQGVAILYITHKMDEIFRIADDITIIRDGQWIESGPATDYDANKLVSRMVGREITNVFPKEDDIPIGDVVLEVKNLTQEKQDGGRFENISFTLRQGEILGFSGLVGAGRSEVMRAVFGLDPYTSGEILMEGKPVSIRNTADAIRAGIAMVSEDRKGYGLVLGRNIRDNISLVTLRDFVKNGLIDDKAIVKRAGEMVDMLNIKIANLDVAASTLSGGNQQKVVLAKWLIGDVKVMILDEPTRGIDVGAKSEIHKLMCRFARQGMAVIMISSELPEVLGMADRVVVMQEGRINGVLERREATQESIMKLATRGKNRE